MVRFRLTEGKVCSNPDMFSKSDGRTLYKLVDSSQYGTCSDKVGSSVFDTRYDLVGTVKEDRLFSDNGILPVLSTLPEYPMQDTYKYSWNLYSNEYFFWNTICETTKNYDRKSMIGLVKGAQDVASYQYTLEVLCIIQFVLFCCILEPIAICKLCSKDGDCGCGMPQVICQVVSFTLKVIFAVIIGYYFYKCIANIDDYEDDIWELKEANCSSAYAQEIFKSYGHSLVSSVNKNYYGLGLTVVSLILSCIYFMIQLAWKSSYKAI